MPDYKRMVRREIFRLRGTVTDDMLFSSAEFREYLQGMLDAAVGPSGRCVRLRMLPSGEAATAFTDGETVYVNPSSPLLSGGDRLDRYFRILGTMVHETGHLLFTDFSGQRRHMEQLTGGCWWPEAPDSAEAEAALARTGTDPVFASLFFGALAKIRNITEDVYVENRLEQHFSGLFIEGLRRLAEELREQSPTLEEQLAEGHLTSLEILISQLLQLARFGCPKTEGTDLPEAGRILDALKRMAPLMEELKTRRDTPGRCRLLNGLLLLALPFVEEAAEDAASAPGAAERLAGEAGGLFPRVDSAPVDWDPPSPDGREGSAPAADLKEMEEKLVRSIAEAKAEGAHVSALRSEAAAIAGRTAAETRERLRTGGSPDGKKREILEYRRSHSLPASAVRIHRPDPFPGSVSFIDGIRRGVSAAAGKTLRLAEAALKERQRGGKETGLACGRHIAPRSLCRPDGRIFSRSSLPDGKPDVSACVLIDESGSMFADGRIRAARNAAVLLETVLRELLEPSSYGIIGHSADLDPPEKTLDLYVYKDFDDDWEKARYRLADIQARAQNRDADAVRYCCERLLSRPERRKLLIVITDGTPLALDYGGAEADRELSLTAAEYRRRGVAVFAASIGDPETGKAVESIFGPDWTMDCGDLSTLPGRLASLLRRIVCA